MSVATRTEGRVLVISMQREAKRNAIDAAMTAGIDAALNRLDDDASLWAGVLTGTATVFSAGTDLAVGPGPPTDRGGPYGIIRRKRRRPLIAAVEGPALGGGLEIVLACDLVVAASDARLGLPEVSRGVLATCGGLFRGPRALPLNHSNGGMAAEDGPRLGQQGSGQNQSRAAGISSLDRPSRLDIRTSLNMWACGQVCRC